MKKILLTLLTVVMSVSAWAAEETLTLTGTTGITTTLQGTSGSGSDMEISSTGGNVTVTGTKAYFSQGSNGVQIYAGGTMTVSVPAGFKISKIVMNLASSCCPFSETPDSPLSLKDGKTTSAQDATYTISPSESSVTFTNTVSAQTKVKKLIVTYEMYGSEDIYIWNGTGSTTAATQIGGTASVPVESSTNMVAGASQKGNYCFKINKGVSSDGGPYVILITLDQALKAGDVITGAVFRTGESAATLGIDYLAADATAAPAHSLADPQVLAANGTPEDNINFTVPESADGASVIRLYRNSGGTGLYVSKFQVTRYNGDNVTIGSAGYATYVAQCPLDFDGTGVTAYTVTPDLTNNQVILAPVTKVPAGKAIVIEGAEGTHSIKGIASADDITTSLEASATATAYDSEYTYYYLGVDNGTVGFRPLAVGGSIAAGKCFFKVANNTPAPANFLTLSFSDEATGIQSVQQNAQNGVAYNLAGQRVAANAKGIVIMNGKKYLNK